MDSRPWPEPTSPWVMRMQWNQLLFAHWPVAAETLRAALPKGLELETWQGQAWLGIVPFTMVDVSPRGVPHVPFMADFSEINVRTYVTYGGKQGVWFFSLDAANRLAVRVARWAFHLPYFDAAIRLERESDAIRYHSVRRGGTVVFSARYWPMGPVATAAPGSFDAWLTSRYCFYSVAPSGTLYRSEVDHALWPLQPASCEIEINTMAAALGLPLPNTPPILHYSDHLDVIGWLPKKVS